MAKPGHPTVNSQSMSTSDALKASNQLLGPHLSQLRITNQRKKKQKKEAAAVGGITDNVNRKKLFKFIFK